MKTKLLALIMFLIPLTAYPWDASLDQPILVSKSISHLHPKLKGDFLDLVTISIIKSSKEHHIDWKILVSIISQESSFKKDPQNCLKSKFRCLDLGIAQINWDTWGKPMHLNRIRLLTDVAYNIEVMSKILETLQAKYGHESQWPTRYHSFTPKCRRIYADYIYHKYLQVTSYIKGFVDGAVLEGV